MGVIRSGAFSREGSMQLAREWTNHNAGNPEIPHAKIGSVSPANISSPPSVMKPRRKHHLVLWTILALFLLFVGWTLLSASPFAQVLREILGQRPDQIVLQRPFSVSPHSFRYYTFRLPTGANKVFLTGQFTAVEGATLRALPSSSENRAEADGIELLLLTESSFTAWQKGAKASSLYDSGPVSHADVRVQILQSEQLYYVVFSNRLSQSTVKQVNASLALRFGSWLPDWIHR